MKLIIALTIFLGVSLHATTYSQNTKLNLDIRNQSIREVLRTIESQSNFRFFYNDEFTDLNKTVTVSFTNKTVEEILASVFSKSEVTYKILENNFIVITPAGVQQTKISGKVTDATTGESMPGVIVIVEGSNIGATTDMEGKFVLDVPVSNAVIVFSFMGYLTEKVIYTGQKTIDVSLTPDIKALDEVVVIGYGTQRKGDVTSAVVSVKEKDFTAGAVRDAGELIKGKVAGLTISNASGDPTAGSVISLRGVASLKGNSTPLVLVNGIESSLNSIAPEEIESIDVLKDASAAAIYGTRGANGVILITTKSVARNVPVQLTYSPYVAISNFVRKADFCTAADFEKIADLGWDLPFDDEGYDTDWLKEITRTGVTHNHNLNLTGGTARGSYVANASYNKTDGTFKKSDNEELKLSFDINQYMFDDKLKININVIKGFQNYGALGDGRSIDTRIYRNALIRNPTSPIKDADGNWAEDKTAFQYYNPVAWVEETNGLIQREWSRMTSNITLTPITGWETNLMVSQSISSSTSGYAETKKHWSNTFGGKNGFASRGFGKGKANYLDLTSKYSKKLADHKFSVLGGYSYQYIVNEGGWANNYDFPTDEYSYNNLGSGYALAAGKAGMGSSKSDETLIGFFGRATYSFGDRFNLLASIRREGSSKFGANYKWGSFPSISAGWTISNETFMKSVDVINNLKVRVGYGVTGIIPSAPYMSKTLLNYQDYIYNNGVWVKGLVAGRNPNPDLRWEKSAEINIGLEFAVLNSRITGTIDVYKKNSTDLLWDYPVPTPPNLVNTTLANVGEIENKGIEILLNTTPVKTSNFEWNSNFTLSHNQNKVVSLANAIYQLERDYVDVGGISDPISMSTHRIQPGKSIGNFWGMKSVDITSRGIWIIEEASGKRDTLTAQMYDDAHKQYLGNGIPKLHVGWINNFRYKQFDLSMVVNAAFGFQILNFQRMFYENKNIAYNRLRSAYYKVYDKAVLEYPQQTYVSYYLEDGDYVKLDNLTIGYNFKAGKLKYVKAFRIYASGSNLLTLTKYKGIDPEIPRYDRLAQGNDDRDKYPSLRTITFGLNVTF